MMSFHIKTLTVPVKVSILPKIYQFQRKKSMNLILFFCISLSWWKGPFSGSGGILSEQHPQVIGHLLNYHNEQ
jgi:hypothetical protein